MVTSTTSNACSLLILTLNPMTTTTEQPTPFTRLALAACPTPLRCPAPCDTCTGVARNVAGELGQILRERHGGSSQVADWLEGFTHTGDER
jgi:hypothetical protein